MYSAHDTPKGWVSPFGHPRINDRSHLPAAFRSVPRPSSPPGAKASTECPSFTPTPPPARRTQPHHTGTADPTRPIGHWHHPVRKSLTSALQPSSRQAERTKAFTHQIQIHHAKQHGIPRQALRPIRRVFRITWAPARNSHQLLDTPAPNQNMETIGFEPMTPCLQSRCSPAELRPHRNEHSDNTHDQPQAATTADQHGPGRT